VTPMIAGVLEKRRGVVVESVVSVVSVEKSVVRSFGKAESMGRFSGKEGGKHQLYLWFGAGGAGASQWRAGGQEKQARSPVAGIFIWRGTMLPGSIPSGELLELLMLDLHSPRAASTHRRIHVPTTSHHILAVPRPASAASPAPRPPPPWRDAARQIQGSPQGRTTGSSPPLQCVRRGQRGLPAAVGGAHCSTGGLWLVASAARKRSFCPRPEKEKQRPSGSVCKDRRVSGSAV
jgi:hypothetical protein